MNEVKSRPRGSDSRKRVSGKSGAIHYPAPNKNGVEEKLSNPAKQLVELRGIEPLTLRLPVSRKREK
jgi:hypothetical protein